MHDSTKSHSFLVTGGTGSVGIEVLRLLAKDRHAHRVSVLIRAKDEEHLQKRWRRLVRCLSDDQCTPEDLPGWRPLHGDVEQPDMGLAPAALDELASEVTAVVHSAANVSFTDALEVYRRINVEGTRHALQVAERCRKLEKFAHVSSLYVAGRRSGEVGEGELEHNAGFTTTGYQESKYEAEVLVREYMQRVPIAVYRLSLLMGRADDGYVHDFGAVHRFLQCMFQGICPVLPARPECPLDFLPNDYSARQMMALFLRHFDAGQTYQISAGKKALTATRWMELTAETFAGLSRSWKRGIFLPPDIVDWPHYKLYVETVAQIGNVGLKYLTGILDSCSEELFYPKVFDRSRVDHALSQAPDQVPDHADYYPRVLEYCVNTHWGRKPRFERI